MMPRMMSVAPTMTHIIYLSVGKCQRWALKVAVTMLRVRDMIRIVERIHADGAVRIIPVDERLIRGTATNKAVMDKARYGCRRR